MCVNVAYDNLNNKRRYDDDSHDELRTVAAGARFEHSLSMQKFNE